MFNSEIAHRFFIIAPVEKSPGSPHVCGIFHPPLQYTKPAAFFQPPPDRTNTAASRQTCGLLMCSYILFIVYSIYLFSYVITKTAVVVKKFSHVSGHWHFLFSILNLGNRCRRTGLLPGAPSGGRILIIWRERMMNQTLKRAVISAVIFAVVYLGAGLVTQMPAYDGLVKTLEFMSGIIAAGCYWIGSK